MKSNPTPAFFASAFNFFNLAAAALIRPGELALLFFADDEDDADAFFFCFALSSLAFPFAFALSARGLLSTLPKLGPSSISSSASAASAASLPAFFREDFADFADFPLSFFDVDFFGFFCLGACSKSSASAFSDRFRFFSFFFRDLDFDSLSLSLAFFSRLSLFLRFSLFSGLLVSLFCFFSAAMSSSRNCEKSWAMHSICFVRSPCPTSLWFPSSLYRARLLRLLQQFELELQKQRKQQENLVHLLIAAWFREAWQFECWIADKPAVMLPPFLPANCDSRRRRSANTIRETRQARLLLSEPNIITAHINEQTQSTELHQITTRKQRAIQWNTQTEIQNLACSSAKKIQIS